MIRIFTSYFRPLCLLCQLPMLVTSINYFNPSAVQKCTRVSHSAYSVNEPGGLGNSGTEQRTWEMRSTGQLALLAMNGDYSFALSPQVRWESFKFILEHISQNYDSILSTTASYLHVIDDILWLDITMHYPVFTQKSDGTVLLPKYVREMRAGEHGTLLLTKIYYLRKILSWKY